MSKLTIYDKEIYLLIIVFANENFFRNVKKTLSTDFHFEKIYKKIVNQIEHIANNEFEF